jgi:adenine-specific DNA-methyltransferase
MPISPITPADPESRTPDLVAENIATLKTLFPELITEGKDGASVNVDVLKALVGDKTLTDATEKYGLNWFGKRRARQLALTSSTGTLRPCPKDSEAWDTTKNLMIEGDNLEVLKLLQKSYANRVKLIYIDPPYNTGKDFVYPDDYQDNIKNYLIRTGQMDSDGRKNTTNPDSGEKHTNWLNMISPRIELCHGLLKQDGAVFVSCDEVEQPRLRLMMDSVFGEENFVADLVWAAGRKNDSRLISISHEYIVCYAKDKAYLTEQKIEWRQRKKGLEDIYGQYEKLKKEYGHNYSSMTDALKEWYKNLQDGHPSKAHKHYSCIDARGVYFPADISWPGGGGPQYEVLHPITGKPVKVPTGGWRFSKPEEFERQMSEGRIEFGEDENKVPCRKSYLKEHEYQAPYSVFYQDGRAASKRLLNLLDGNAFDFPKDETILQETIGMMSSASDIILDFFAGSGTTGHAVMAQNAADGGKRRYILVQLPELLDPSKSEQKTAANFCDSIGKPRTIAEITKERLRRAAKKIRGENPMFAGDLGFRVFKLDSSNIKEWDPHAQDLAKTLEEHVQNLKQDRSEDDILFELLLKLGIDLSTPIEQRTIAGHAVHAIGVGTLVACLSKSFPDADAEPVAQGIVAWLKELAPKEEDKKSRQTTVVFRDSAFESDVGKTNLAAILNQHGIENVRSI